MEGGQSNIVGEGSLTLGKLLSTETKLRFNQDTNELTRVDSSVRLKSKWVEASARCFRLNNASSQLVDTLNAPQEEIKRFASLNLSKNWSTSYSATRDLDNDTTRKQSLGVRYRDDCTLIEFLYTQNRFNNDAIRDNSSFGIPVSLLTLGD